MRNYIRYIVILVLIIAGGLLLISVVNKFTEPEKGKVDNSTKTEEKAKKPTVEMIEPTSPSDEETEESTEEETTSTPTKLLPHQQKMKVKMSQLQILEQQMNQ